MNRIFFRLAGFFRALMNPSRWRFGQFTHIDYQLTFRVLGQIVDAASGDALPDTRVYFIDTGLDEIRSRDPYDWIKFPGMGDATGNVAIEFTYTWGALRRTVVPPTGSFEIRIEHFGYEIAARTFEVQNLPRSDNQVTAELGTVPLTHRNASRISGAGRISGTV